MAGKIYTKTGDAGKTGTFHGRMSKTNPLAVALGTVDELNSWVGLCRVETTGLEEQLVRIQHNLLTIGSGLAGSGKQLNDGEVTRLEMKIDEWTKQLPPLANFILPTGKGGAAYLQVARVVARRAEREVVATEKAAPEVLAYLNRLSDWLFTAARWTNKNSEGGEEIWK